MRLLVIAISCLILTGCCTECNKQQAIEESYYVPTVIENDYKPATGKTFHVAGFDVKQGQQMRDFFDDFKEPMHTYYSGNNVDWTYYVDYNRNNDEGKIVRYCELKDYAPHSLCAVKVSFVYTYVSNAVTNCR